MSEPIWRKPRPGDTVTIGDGEERFAVLDFDGSTYLLESRHGTRCRAGVLVVRLAERREAA